MLQSIFEKITSFAKQFTGKKEFPIEVFVRHCHYSSASAHKTRFPEFSKEKCFQNLLSTIDQTQVHVTFFLDTFHSGTDPHFLQRQNDFPVVEMKAGTEAASFLFLLDYVMQKNWNPETILYFLEDDYIHRPHWTQVLREAFALPGVDYVTLYDHKDKYFLPQYEPLASKIFCTPSCHWRTTPSTTNTYAMRFKTLKKHLEIHRLFSIGRSITADHDKFSRLREEGATLISAIPGFSTHAEPEFASPCVDWQTFLK